MHVTADGWGRQENFSVRRIFFGVSVAFGPVAAVPLGVSVKEERKDRCGATGSFALPKHRNTEPKATE